MASKNVYAETIEGKKVYIKDVERGRKGYYCIGCNERLEARRGVQREYFAHIPKNIPGYERKCTYSDEKYRHKLAKEILQRIKKIKVPDLYKFPPSDIDRKPNRIRQSYFIYAKKVRNELQFYEDEIGEIKYGKGISFLEKDKRSFLIQPDVTFFDENDEPILFIEIAVTHKVDIEKLAKLKKIGIDTIEVTIPKDSPKEIEDTFYKTSRTEWIFNYEQETSQYFYIPRGNDEGILSDYEFQRRISKAKESYECRSSQIKNLIRGIRKSLAGEQYLRIKHRIGEEFSRVEKNTERSQNKLDRLQEQANQDAREAIRPRRICIKKEEERLEQKDSKFQLRTQELDERYRSKREGLEREEEEYGVSNQNEIERITGRINNFGSSPSTIRRSLNDLEEEEIEFRRSISRKEEEIKEQGELINKARRKIEERRVSLQDEYHRIEEEVRREFNKKRRELDKRIEEDRKGIESDEDRYRTEVLEAIERRNSEGTSRIHGRIKDTFRKFELLLHIREGQSSLKRLKTIKRILDSREYEKWV